MHTPTRLCVNCSERKTVRGIWYLVAVPGDDEPAFFCEGCFSRGSAAVSVASSADATLPLAAVGELNPHGNPLGLR